MRTYDERNNRQSYYDDHNGRSPSRGRPYGNGRARYDEEERPRYQSEREPSEERPVGVNMDLTEWNVAHEIRVKHITVTIWQRVRRSERPVYSLTLTRTFRSHQRGGYLSTNKLFADDAPLAAEAFRLAGEWLEQGAAPSEASPF